MRERKGIRVGNRDLSNVILEKLCFGPEEVQNSRQTWITLKHVFGNSFQHIQSIIRAFTPYVVHTRAQGKDGLQAKSKLNTILITIYTCSCRSNLPWVRRPVRATRHNEFASYTSHISHHVSVISLQSDTPSVRNHMT